MAIARLQIESGNDRGKEVDLARIMVIGRSAGCDLVLNDESCSRMHVRLRPEGDACRIEDLGSTNGTYVNGERLSTGHLKDGDLFTVGGTSIRLRWPSFDAGATVVLEAAAREQARVADRIELADGSASPQDGAAAPLLHALIGLLQSTRGVPDTHAVARALCDQSRQLLAADRTAVLLLRSGGEGAVAVSSSNLRLDAGRPWVAEALRERRALLLEDDRGKKPLSAVVVPMYRGLQPLALLYADRRKRAFDKVEVPPVLELARAAESLLQTADLHEQLRLEFVENRTRIEGERRIVGESQAHQTVVTAIRHAAPGSHPVLFIGETGTGKELFARYLHEISPRAEGPLLAVNCSATPEGFLEPELFGTQKNMASPHSGATIGALERARGGTLFLDEIDAMDLAGQARLAAALRDRKVRRPADDREVPLDVRLVAASDRDLAQMAREGGFHEDLLALLAMGTIRVPPLRERADDIPLLADHFLKLHARRMNRKARRLSPDALRALTAYQWPGNVRELSNVIERAVMLAGEEEVPAKLLPFPLDPTDLLLSNVEKLAIDRALQFCHYKKGQAAKALGISWPTLNKKINDYGIRIPNKA